MVIPPICCRRLLCLPHCHLPLAKNLADHLATADAYTDTSCHDEDRVRLEKSQRTSSHHQFSKPCANYAPAEPATPLSALRRHIIDHRDGFNGDSSRGGNRLQQVTGISGIVRDSRLRGTWGSGLDVSVALSTQLSWSKNNNVRRRLHTPSTSLSPSTYRLYPHIFLLMLLTTVGCRA